MGRDLREQTPRTALGRELGSGDSHATIVRMSWRRWAPIATAAAIGIGLIACSQVLGLHEPEVVASETSETSEGGVASGGGGEGGVSAAACSLAKDCPAIVTTPPDCAEVECRSGACRYRARDVDQDGQRASLCAAVGITIELGSDCDDHDGQLYDGHPRECSASSTGTAITFPFLPPRGACRLGTQSCTGGSLGPCVGTVGPTTELCSGSADEDCDGNAFNGCTCTPGMTQPCGHAQVGICKPGTTSCVTVDGGASTFGPCLGSIEPAAVDCSNGLAHNCNGAVDTSEASCAGPGGGTPGSTRACNAHAQDGVGVCHAGTQTCNANGSSSSWGPCSGDVGPTAEQCDGNDYDCNGVAGVDDPAPPAPAGTLNCAKVFRCDAGGLRAARGPLFYRTGIGWTNIVGTNVWMGYATRGVFTPTPPAGQYRISRDGTGTKMGPVSVSSVCCGASGCPTANVLYDGAGQFYTLP